MGRLKNFLRSWAFKVLAVVAALLVGVMIYGAVSGGFSTIPETVMGVVITLIQTFFTNAGNAIGDFFGNLGSDRAELEALRKENNALREQLTDYYEIKKENEWYEQIFGLHEEHSDYTFAYGTAIARDPDDYYGGFTIDVGTAGGVAVGDPVVTAEGLVGVVSEVGLTYSRVRTVLDPGTHAAATIARTGDTGYTSGSALLASLYAIWISGM
jgi:rod shape-determining protein MreC